MPEKNALLLIQKIATAAQNLDDLRAELDGIQRRCRHQWGPVFYDPKIQKGYTVPADPPGVGGVDRRVSSIHVPEETTPRWKQTCRLCQLTRETQQTTDKVQKIPVFSDR